MTNSNENVIIDDIEGLIKALAELSEDDINHLIDGVTDEDIERLNQ